MKTKNLLTIILYSASISVVVAQPANDLICNATPLTTDGVCVAATNVAATYNSADPDPLCWSGFPNYDVWFSFVADNDSMEISTDYSGYTLTDIEMAVYSSSDNTCTGTMMEIGCNEDVGATFSCSNPPINNYYSAVVVFNGSLVPGNTYFVRIDGNGTTGTFCISAGPIIHVLPTQTPNELIGSTCELATIIHPNNMACNFLNGNTALGGTAQWTHTVGVNYCGCDNETNQKGGWVTFTATGTTTTVKNLETYALEYTVFSGTCAGLTCISCTSKNGGLSFSIATTIGTQYFILITRPSGSTSNTGTDVCVIGGGACTPPPNDNCSNATPINAGLVYPTSVYCATPDDVLCAGSTENNIWYSWTVPLAWTGDANFSAFDHNCVSGVFSAGTQVSIYDAGQTCTTTSTCAICANIGNDNDYAISWTPTPGATYLINFDGNGGEVCNFSFTIEAAPLILPIELLSFNGECIDNYVQLNWQTASESNNDYFLVEKSMDGSIFYPVTKVRATGNSSTLQKYGIRDEESFGRTAYYRLSQTDNDGYTKIFNNMMVAVNGCTADNTVIWSTGNEIRVTVKGEKSAAYSIVVHDMLGRIVENRSCIFTKDNPSINFPINAANGIYMVTVFNGVNIISTQKISIQR